MKTLEILVTTQMIGLYTIDYFFLPPFLAFLAVALPAFCLALADLPFLALGLDIFNTIFLLSFYRNQLHCHRAHNS